MNDLVMTTKNVSVTAENRTLISDISIDVKQGKILAVVGPNGAGKTTLLKAMIGDQNISSGQIYLSGKPLPDWSIQQKAKVVATLPQFSLLNFPYSVNEVVSLGRIPHSTGHKIDQSIVNQAMKYMDIGHLSEHPYPLLSGGEKQRTQLARVLTQIWREEDSSQRLLLLDEPTTALDLGHQQQLMDAVIQFTHQGVAVLMVVHDINIAAKYADETIALSKGHSIAQGKTEQVLTESVLQELFSTKLYTVTHPQTGKTAILL